jgi:hypothetical protein
MSDKERSQKGVDVSDLAWRMVKPYMPFIVVFVIVIISLVIVKLVFSDVVRMMHMILVVNLIMVIVLLAVVYQQMVVRGPGRLTYSSFLNIQENIRRDMTHSRLIFAIVMIPVFVILFFLFFTQRISFEVFFIILMSSNCASISYGYYTRKKYTGSVSEWYNNIIVRHGKEIPSMQNGFTSRPYSQKIFGASEDPSRWKRTLEAFGQAMSMKMLIMGYTRMVNCIVYYLPSPVTYSGMMGSKRDLEKASRVTVYDDGTMSVNMAREDYDRIGVETTYHTLCQNILRTFAEAIREFYEGNEIQALMLVGGKDYFKRRRKVLRSYAAYLARVCTVLITVMILFYAMPIPQEAVVIDRTYDNAHLDENMQHPQYIKISVDALSRFMFSTGEVYPKEGDRMLVKFEANTTIPEAYIYRYIDGEKVYIGDFYRNVTSGEFRFEGDGKFDQYVLVFNLWSESDTGVETITIANIDVTIVHLNSKSVHNYTMILILLIVYPPIEFVYWVKRQKLMMSGSTT